MTRDEWFASPEFIRHKMLNNLASEIGQKVQQFNDMLVLFHEKHPDLVFTDKFAIVDRQQRIVHLEADKLWTAVRKLVETVKPEIEQ